MILNTTFDIFIPRRIIMKINIYSVIFASLLLIFFLGCSEDSEIDSVLVSPHTLTIPPNGTYTLKASVIPTENSQDVTWASSDSGLVSVDANGVITAGSVEGSAIITATSDEDSDVSGTCTVTVEPTDSDGNDAYGESDEIDTGFIYVLLQLDDGAETSDTEDWFQVEFSECTEYRITLHPVTSGAMNLDLEFYAPNGTYKIDESTNAINIDDTIVYYSAGESTFYIRVLQAGGTGATEYSLFVEEL